MGYQGGLGNGGIQGWAREGWDTRGGLGKSGLGKGGMQGWAREEWDTGVG